MRRGFLVNSKRIYKYEVILTIKWVKAVADIPKKAEIKITIDIHIDPTLSNASAIAISP
jgi:hypothetical protein